MDDIAYIEIKDEVVEQVYTIETDLGILEDDEGDVIDGEL